MNGEGYNLFVLMHEFGYTFDDLSSLSPAQLTFLLEGLRKHYRDQARAAKRASRRRR